MQVACYAQVQRNTRENSTLVGLLAVVTSRCRSRLQIWLSAENSPNQGIALLVVFLPPHLLVTRLPFTTFVSICFLITDRPDQVVTHTKHPFPLFGNFTSLRTSPLRRSLARTSRGSRFTLSHQKERQTTSNQLQPLNSTKALDDFYANSRQHALLQGHPPPRGGYVRHSVRQLRTCWRCPCWTIYA